MKYCRMNMGVEYDPAANLDIYTSVECRFRSCPCWKWSRDWGCICSHQMDTPLVYRARPLDNRNRPIDVRQAGKCPDNEHAIRENYCETY